MGSSCGNVYEVIIAVLTGYYLCDFWVVAKTWKGEQLVSFKKAGSLKIYFKVECSSAVWSEFFSRQFNNSTATDQNCTPWIKLFKKLPNCTRNHLQKQNIKHFILSLNIRCSKNNSF